MAGSNSKFLGRPVAAAAAILLVAAVLMVQSGSAEAQSCSNLLNNLNICAPFVLPGATNTNPSADCCNALEAVQHDCLCSTLRIASTLPSLCHLPPLSCGVN